MWKDVKWEIVESVSEVCATVKVKRKNPKNVWWNYVPKTAV